MSGTGGWFSNLFRKMKTGLVRFMYGRYGTDKLNTAILVSGVLACLIALLIPYPIPKIAITLFSYGLMIWAICRSLSRKTYKRYEENRKYLMFLQRLKDRQHRYYNCPRCRQQVRVPRGKGKIAITCPKCKEKFIKKT